jgi:hypothetical protein
LLSAFSSQPGEALNSNQSQSKKMKINHVETLTNHKAGNFIQSQSEKLPASAVQLRLTADGIQLLSDKLLLSFTGIVCMLYVGSTGYICEWHIFAAIVQ